MKPLTLAMAAHQGESLEQHRCATRRDKFLSTMVHLDLTNQRARKHNEVDSATLCSSVSAADPKNTISD